jgi:hypothetical protein
MTDKEYRELDAESQSGLKMFMKNRKNYEYCMVLGLGTNGSTKSMDLGSVNHTLIFEPQEFHNRYAYFEGTSPSASAQMKKFYDLVFLQEIPMKLEDAYCNCYSTKSMKPEAVTKAAYELRNNLLPYYNFHAEHGEKDMLTPADEMKSRQMVEIFHQHEGVRKTLLAGRNNPNAMVFKEAGLIWELPHLSKRPLKGKMDEMHLFIDEQLLIIYDYKTTNAPNVNAFKSSAKFYGYDTQESFYAIGAKEWVKRNFNLDVTVVFRFIPQLNVLPYNVLDVIEFDADDREAAYLEWSEALKELDKCRETGQFDNPAAYSESGVNKMKLRDTSNLVILEDGF